MTAERWGQIKQLFQQTLVLAPEARSSFLDQHCSSDPELRREVLSLLEADREPDHLIDQPAFAAAANLLQPASQAEAATTEFHSLAGQTISTYELIREIARGGMGEVHLAYDTRLGRNVALKLLPTRFTQDSDRVQRFQREARAASALNHPNIVTIHDFGHDSGHHYMATELVEGQTLRNLLGTAEMTLNKSLDIAIQVASALDAAHEAGIIHRDIKPENIMLRPDGYVKVLDFGLAKLAEQTAEPVASGQEDVDDNTSGLATKTGWVLGTVRYMSPEQARGQKVDHRTDIFSLGVVLYETITGHPPFQGETRSHTTVAIMEEAPIPLTEYVPYATAQLQRIVDNALRKKRDERYQTMREMLDDLQVAREEIVFRARREQNSLPVGEVSHQEHAVAGRSRRGLTTGVFWTAILAITASALAFGVYEYIRARGAPFSQSGTGSSLPQQPVKLRRITANGNISQVALSPDGKQTVYVAGPPRQQSLWLMQGATGSHRQIIPPADGVQYWGLTLSNDGDYIYYVTNVEQTSWELQRVPTIGGTSRRLLVDIDTAVTFSPDGQRFAFVRQPRYSGETRLMVANADGSEEMVLATREAPDFFLSSGLARISWSPDGESIACPAGNTELAPDSMEVVEVRLKDGTEKPITRRKWRWVSEVAWLRDGSGLVLIGDGQIWRLSYPGGEASKVTNDLSIYTDISVTADTGVIGTVQSDRFCNIWVAPGGDAGRSRQITNSRTDGDGGISWTPDGRVVYSSLMSGDRQIWMMNADGGNRQRLTDHPGRDISPSVSRDGRYVVFTSNRAGKRKIWRMDIDGGNPVQLTNGGRDSQPDCSPDGRWVYYSAPGIGSVRMSAWKVPIDGGDPVLVNGNYTSRPIVSPDQKLIAFTSFDLETGPRAAVAVGPVAGGQPVKLFNIDFIYRWTPDGHALAYLDDRSQNVWAQPLDGGKPVRLTNFNTDQTFDFAWSRDGKQLALARGSVASDLVLITDFK